MKRFWLSVVTVAILALPSVASAQAPRYKRSSPKVKVKVRKTERTQGLKAKKDVKKETRPQISADEFLDIQGQVKHIRGAQIKALQRLIDDTDANDAELPDLLFRLAEQYAQQQRYWRFRAFEMYDKIERSKSKSAKRKFKAKQKQYFKAEKGFLTRAIGAYAKIANNDAFKNFPRMDLVLFSYAFTLQKSKRLDLARKVYHKLIKNYPRSKYIADAYLAFADYFFEQNNLSDAEKFYNKVLQFPKSSAYTYAMYKKGWVYLNQDRNQDALETFFEVVKKTKGDKKRIPLNKAAKKDFVRAYAEVGRAEKAYPAFQRVDKGYAFNMLRILGGIYFDQGKAAKSIYTYRELMGLRPKDKRVCEWQYNIVTAMMSAGDKGRQATEVERLVKLYTRYRDKKLLRGSALSECAENAQATAGELAKVWHVEAIKTLSTDTLGYVEKLYKSYVKSFPNAEDIGDMRYYYAELLWTRAENEKNPRRATEMWEKAAIAFTDVVQGGKVSAKLTKEAAYAAVLGWKNALAVDPRTAVKTIEMTETNPEKIPESKPITERQQKMISAFDIYIKYIKNPKDEELVMMKFLKARIYWRHHQLDKAAPIFEDIIKNHVGHETAEYSVNILLDSYNRLQQYDKLLYWVDYLLKQKSFLSERDELAGRLRHIKAQSRRKNASALEKGGKNIECGDAYREIYNLDPDGKNMDEVLYNAGVCYEQGNSIGLALAMFGKLSERFKNSKSTQRALVRMGNLYGAVAFYAQAASKYEQYAKKYGGEKDASKALSNAVVYRKGLGEDSKAIANIDNFVKQYKNKKGLKNEAADASFSKVGIYEKRGEKENVIKHLTKYLRDFGTKGGRDRVVVAHAKMGQIYWQRSCKVRGVDGSCIKVRRERALRRSKRKRRKGTVLPTQCGAASKIKLTVLSRDKRLAAKARTHFRKAISEFGKMTSLPGDEKVQAARRAQAVYWYAAARFYSSEADYENFLGLKFPTKLNFSPQKPKVAKKSVKRFKDWIAKKTKMAKTTAEKFRAVADIKGGGQAWRIAAAARTGQVFQNFADGLYTAEVPKDQRTGPYAEDSWDAYCDQLTTEATPLEEISVGSFGFCLEKSTELNWFNQWSKLCEKELGQIRPQDYPTASELHAEPNLSPPIVDTQGAILTL